MIVQDLIGIVKFIEVLTNYKPNR